MVELDIGYVGEVTRVDPTILNVLGNDGYIPVVATIATDASSQALNINADTAAGRCAVLRAPRSTVYTELSTVHEYQHVCLRYLVLPAAGVSCCSQLAVVADLGTGGGMSERYR